MHQVTAFSCRFWRNLYSFAYLVQTAKIKNENVDCEAYKKPNVKKFTLHDMGKLLRSNHDDLLQV